MANSKSKDVKKYTFNDENDKNEVKNFIIILIVLVLVGLGVYVFTKYAVNDGDVFINPYYAQAGVINNNKVIAGTMLNKEESNYYVIAYHSDSATAAKYSIILEQYLSIGTGREIYFLDLDNSLNKDYIATDEKPVNEDAEDISDLALGTITLMEIDDNKIDKYITSEEEIVELLSLD